MTKVNEFSIEDVLLAFQNEYDESQGYFESMESHDSALKNVNANSEIELTKYENCRL